MATKNGRVVATAAEDEDYVEGYDSGANRKVLIPMTVLRAGQFDGWRDLRAPLIGAKSAGVSDPTLSVFGVSGDIRQYKFAVGNEVYLAFHIDHDIKVGSTVYPHVHWAGSSTDINLVKWEFEYTVAARTDAAAFPAPSTIDLQEAPSATAWAHQVTEDAVGFAAPEVDSLVLVHLTRVTNGGTENTDDIYGLFVDLHYETDRVSTPSRTPPFYS